MRKYDKKKPDTGWHPISSRIKKTKEYVKEKARPVTSKYEKGKEKWERVKGEARAIADETGVTWVAEKGSEYTSEMRAERRKLAERQRKKRWEGIPRYETPRVRSGVRADAPLQGIRAPRPNVIFPGAPSRGSTRGRIGVMQTGQAVTPTFFQLNPGAVTTDIRKPNQLEQAVSVRPNVAFSPTILRPGYRVDTNALGTSVSGPDVTGVRGIDLSEVVPRPRKGPQKSSLNGGKKKRRLDVVEGLNLRGFRV